LAGTLSRLLKKSFSTARSLSLFSPRGGRRLGRKPDPSPLAQDKSFTQGVERTAETAPIRSEFLNTLLGISASFAALGMPEIGGVERQRGKSCNALR